MSEIFDNIPQKLDHLIAKVDSGFLGLPDLQRPFVWSDTKVRDLLDSMMRGYPIGYLMLWECPVQDSNRTIGANSHGYTSPREVIIDGQQRLTSLYAIMKGQKVINAQFKPKEIIISYNPGQNKFEVANSTTKNSAEWIPNISELFTSQSPRRYINDYIDRLENYRKANGKELPADEEDIISNRIDALVEFKNYTLPVFSIKADADEEDVAEIFVRVNSGGTPLKQNDFILTLLSLYWDEGRKEIEEFSKTSLIPPSDNNSTSFNSITAVNPQDVVRVVMAYAFDRARLKYGYKLLRGAQFDKKGAVDIALRQERRVSKTAILS